MGESAFDPHVLGVEAYLYLYPLVSMEVTRRQVTNAEAGEMPGRAPTGQFAHIRAFPAADFKANWLPGPAGAPGITMRIYAHRPGALARVSWIS